MPLYGSGNWFNLPELGLTEKIGGKKSSVASAQSRTAASSGPVSAVAYSSPAGPARPAVQGASTGSSYTAPTSYSSPAASSSLYKETSSKSKQGIDNSAEDQRKAEEAQKKAFLAQIDAEYNNVIGQIGAEEQSLTQQMPLTEQQIGQSYGEAVPALEQEGAQKVAGLQGQQAGAQQGATSNIGQARQLYNELLSGAGRFGGSAAQAYGEILGRSTAETIGETKQSLVNTVNQIQGEIVNTKNYYSSKINDLTRSKNLAIEQARKDFRDGIAKIANLRTGAAESKRAENLNALATFQSAISKINSAAAIAKQSLDQWVAEKETALAEARDRNVQEYKISLGNVGDIAGAVQGQGLGFTGQGLGDLYALQGTYGNQDELNRALQGVVAQAQPVGEKEEQGTNWWEN